ncbi:hypothetical protein Bsp3421_001873 [Burkholderia sp. FERM BP-3421]|uniref:hypothetical protein n=1 Tax=Burkholderia sp. FERM BP-3421 TaxID=1494466 RepID=UPI0023603586|nr:hypothetical protein [Burkholderia sp. FERM BP-3421]WDD91914.1 hypothetical protein Bsp3421_001873 [Burkholderia sp. FERM BP-3421]
MSEKNLFKPFLCFAAFVVVSNAGADCRVPMTVAGRTFVNVVDDQYSPQNPNAGSVLKVDFGNGVYDLKILQTGQSVRGAYQYSALAPNVGQLRMKENFDGQISDYTVTLVCLTDFSGTLVTTQWQGAIKPDIRQNSGRYNILK